MTAPLAHRGTRAAPRLRPLRHRGSGGWRRRSIPIPSGEASLRRHGHARRRRRRRRRRLRRRRRPFAAALATRPHPSQHAASFPLAARVPRVVEWWGKVFHGWGGKSREQPRKKPSPIKAKSRLRSRLTGPTYYYGARCQPPANSDRGEGQIEARSRPLRAPAAPRPLVRGGTSD